MAPTWAQINLDVVHTFPMVGRTPALLAAAFDDWHTLGYAAEINLRAAQQLWGGESRLTVLSCRAEARPTHAELVFDVAHVYDIGNQTISEAEAAARSSFNAATFQGSFAQALAPLPGSSAAAFREIRLVPEESDNPNLPGNT